MTDGMLNKRLGCYCHTNGAGHVCQLCRDIEAKKILVRAVIEVMAEISDAKK